MVKPLRIGVVAGEASGDLLGAALIEALTEKLPAVEFIGLAGEQMRAAGCEPLGSSEELAVMGLVEPLRHLPRLLRLRARLLRIFQERRIDVFIGIDSPAFNIGLALRMRRRGCITVQYVSPQVWAWRRGRVQKIAAAVDAVLCLLPFEPAAYEDQPVRAEFVGHPLADQIPLNADRQAARQALGIADDVCVVAVLPGSRLGEVGRLGADFVAATRQLRELVTGPLHFVAPLASVRVGAVFRQQVHAAGAQIQLVEQRAHEVFAAADAALVTSGTATLQALLYGCPMVVAYRFAPITAFIARDLGLMKVRNFSLPNLLAEETLVPEFFQRGVTPVALAAALRETLLDTSRREYLRQRFRLIHLQLRQGGATRAAQVVMDLLASRYGTASGSA
ncbi:MAG: lipid-A-disaccharide synthase [Steroidobacteraceae bacterium]